MRLVFAHDHRFAAASDGQIYSAGPFPAAAWKRYLTHFDQVHVIAREGPHPVDTSRLSLSSSPGVEFQMVPDLSSLRQLLLPSSEVDHQLETAIVSADAVVARLPSEVGLRAARLARRLGKPYALEVVGCVWDSCMHHGNLVAPIYGPLAFLRTRRAIAAAPLALYVTSKWLQGRYPTGGQSAIASNVQLLPMSDTEIAAREERLRSLERGRRPVLGTVASLQVMSKGVQTALAALARLRSRGVELEYRVLGAGPIEEWQKRAQKMGVSDLVHFDGTRTAGAGVCNWLDEIDIHLQPSFQEGLPRATIEAMNRGIACIGSTCGGIPELLPAERLHRPGDVAGLAACIDRLAINPAAVVAASRADRETARQFDAQLLEERRSEFYARLRAQAEQQSRSDSH